MASNEEVTAKREAVAELAAEVVAARRSAATVSQDHQNDVDMATLEAEEKRLRDELATFQPAPEAAPEPAAATEPEPSASVAPAAEPAPAAPPVQSPAAAAPPVAAPSQGV